MNGDDIKEFAALMREMDLTSLEYSETEPGGALKMIKLRRGARESAVSKNRRIKQAASGGENTVITDEGIFTVKSPTVGVFYTSPSEGAKPYCEIGDTVAAGDVLCIIEAMKIMNEITAERGGTIVEICAENKQVVEFSQPLFKIKE